MLRKLLKYDIKTIYKTIVIFYLLAFIFSLLTRAFLSFENSLLMNILGEIFKGATISMMCSTVINNVMRSWARFKSNLYGDESYLSHTLPVKIEQHYASKFFSAFITLITSVMIIVAVFLTTFYTKNLFEQLKSILFPATQFLDLSIPAVLAAFAVVIFLEIANILQCGFTGIIIGHRQNTAKTGFSVLFGFIAYMITQTVGVVAILVAAIFNDALLNIVKTASAPTPQAIKLLIYLSIITYSALLIIGYIVNVKLLKKGVNVD